METRGAIFLHRHFKFADGGKADKFLILLNSPISDEPYLFVKTTSQKKHRPSTPGCIESLSCYYIPAGHTFFNKDTWVLLSDIYEISVSSIENNHEVSFSGDLKAAFIDAILDCLNVTQIDNILPAHKNFIWPDKTEGLRKLVEKFGKKSP